MLRIVSVVLVLLLLPTLASAQVIADFNGQSYDGWTAEGNAFGNRPAQGTLSDQMAVTGYEGDGLVNSYFDRDGSTGTLTSPEFTISGNFLSFLIGGGDLWDQVGVELLINGERKHAATGKNSENLDWRSWDVRQLQGQRARLRIFDHATGSWGHILIDEIAFTETPLERPGLTRPDDYRKGPRYYREQYRPQFHFTPEFNWMNDPNGLVYANGEYHLFYQHNPHGIDWGHMCWGHAVSQDLLHWKHLPIALRDEYGVMCFSGSAVLDERNTSGFGKPGTAPLVAIFTNHGYGEQTQDLAFSNDNGRTWLKYAENPVLDLDKSDFRDPKVFWHQETSRWIMVVSLAVEKVIQFYSSNNLKDWEQLSEFGPAGVADKANWECPDLFELPIENEPGQTAWVLEADMGSGSIAGGSGGEYFTGTFNGTRFQPDSLDSLWVDYGRDFYAPVSWTNTPGNRRVWIGWMNNWETCLNPTYPWRSAMSIPRDLTLRRIDGKRRLCQSPIPEVERLRGEAERVIDLQLREETKLLKSTGDQLDIELKLQPDAGVSIGIRVLKDGDQYTEIGYDASSQELYVDRSRSGNVTFHPAFSGRHAGPLKPNKEGTVRVRILVDSCSVEVFGNHGETVITDLVFPVRQKTQIELFTSQGEGTVQECSVYQLDSVWHPNEMN